VTLALAAVLVTTFMMATVKPATATSPIVVISDQAGAWGKITVSFGTSGPYQTIQVKFEWNAYNPDYNQVQKIELVIAKGSILGERVLDNTVATHQWFIIWYWSGQTSGTYTYGPYVFVPAGDYFAFICWGVNLAGIPSIWPQAGFHSTGGGPWQ
jgi:hypothetical protein